jgi:hypothetical protein
MRTKIKIPEPQGNTPMERLDWAFRTVLKVPKAAMAKGDEQARETRRKKTKRVS